MMADLMLGIEKSFRFWQIPKLKNRRWLYDMRDSEHISSENHSRKYAAFHVFMLVAPRALSETYVGSLVAMLKLLLLTSALLASTILMRLQPSGYTGYLCDPSIWDSLIWDKSLLGRTSSRSPYLSVPTLVLVFSDSQAPSKTTSSLRGTPHRFSLHGSPRIHKWKRTLS